MPKHAVALVVLVAGVTGCTGKRPGAGGKGETEIGKLLDARPVPDLSDLAERSAVGRRGEDTGEAFWDILKLREAGTAEAVPVLERILAGHANSTRIHGYAAAQALFHIGTPEAHSVLARHLLSPSYSAGHSIRYVYHWHMDQSKRDEFIERYHLLHLSTDVSLALSVASQRSDRSQRFIFSVTASNVSNEPFRIPDRVLWLGSVLYFRSADGRFAPDVEVLELHKAGPPQYLELKPGGSHQYEIAVDARRADEVDDGHGWYGWLPEDAVLVLTAGGMAYGVHQPGDYEVRAMLEQPKPTEAQARFAGSDNLWSGRAVSEPVRVSVALPSPQ